MSIQTVRDPSDVQLAAVEAERLRLCAEREREGLREALLHTESKLKATEDELMLLNKRMKELE